jgi:hypothetical protein
MKLKRCLGFVLVLFATSGGSAAAQTLSSAEEAARQQLIESSEQAAKAEDFRAALDGAQRAARIRKSLTLMLFIARMQENLQAYADAYASAQQCLREGEFDTKARLREQTLEICRGMVNSLKAKVAHVVVNVPDPPQGLSVRLSGQELNHAAIGIPYLVTPGQIRVEATAPAHVPYRLDVDVPGGGTVNVTVTLAPRPTECPPGQRPDGSGRCVGDTCRVGMLPTVDGASCCWIGQTWDSSTATCRGTPTCPAGFEVSGSTCVERPAPSLALPVAPAEPAGPPPTAGGPRWGLWVGGTGVATLAAAGLTWLVANGRYSRLSRDCELGCEVAERRSRIENIKRIDDWALGTAIAGSALLATGAVLQWMDDARPRETTVAIDPVRRSLLLSGRF